MKRKQSLAVLLALCMTLGMLPMTAFASGDTPFDAIAEIAEDETETQEENKPTEDETETQEENKPTEDETETQDENKPTEEKSETQDENEPTEEKPETPEENEPTEETNEDNITDAETDEEPIDIPAVTLRNASPVSFSKLQDVINGTSTSPSIDVQDEDGTLNIKLNADVEGNGRILIKKGKTVTLDLNGHTISGTGTYVLGIASGATLTVKDTSDGSAGSIIGNTMVINDYGTFHLERGTVRATSANGYAVYVTDSGSLTTSGEIHSKYIGIYTKGDVTVNGGTIDAPKYGIYTKSKNTIINGGIIKADECGVYAVGDQNYGLDAGTVDMTGGSIYSEQYGVNAFYNTKFNMSGGTIEAGKTGAYIGYRAELHMSDGEIKGRQEVVNGDGSPAGVYIYRGGTHTVSGGTISGLCGITIWGYQKLNGGVPDEAPYGKTKLTVSGGTINGVWHGISGNAREDGEHIRGNTIINIEGGEIYAKEGMGIYHPQIGELNISGGIIKGLSGVEVRAGTLNMTGGTVIGNADQFTGEPNGDGNTVTGAGITVSPHVHNRPINVSISGGTIKGLTSFYEDFFGTYAYEALEITGGQFDQFESTGIASVISKHTTTGFITGGSYRYGVDKDYLGSDVHCIKGKIKGNDLPYHVGTLTGEPTDMITMREGEEHDPFVPQYELNGVKMIDVTGNAIVNVEAKAQANHVIDVTYRKDGDSGDFVNEYKERLIPAIDHWTPGNENVATVDKNSGVVTAVRANHDPVEIIATLFNGWEVPFSVKVLPKIQSLDPIVAAYRVEHYREQLDGSYERVDADTQLLFDEIGTTVTAMPNDYEHYHFDGTVPGTVTSDKVVLPSAGTGSEPDILTLKLYYDLDTYKVEFDLKGGTGEDSEFNPIPAKHGQTITLPSAKPTRSGYKFQGWKDENTGMIYQPGDGITVTDNMTLVAQWKKRPSETDEYRLHFESNGGTRYSDEWYEEGTKVSLDKVPKRSGYEFTGWYADAELEDKIKNITMNTDKTVYAGWKKIKDSKPDGDNGDQQDQKPTDVPQLNKEDHFAYVSGYPEGDFRPERNMTRAEVAVMFSNLLLKDTQESTGYGNTFTDVAPSEWYYDRVGFMEQFGIISGYPDGSFRPNAPITRAEFATIAAKFDELKETGNAAFRDLPDDHWGKKFIEMAYNHGWISGYPDGTVKPDKYITRAEVVSVTNRILERVCDQAYIESHKASIKDYFDITNAHWAYYHIMEASNGHLYAKGEQSENWISLNP